MVETHCMRLVALQTRMFIRVQGVFNASLLFNRLSG